MPGTSRYSLSHILLIYSSSTQETCTVSVAFNILKYSYLQNKCSCFNMVYVQALNFKSLLLTKTLIFHSHVLVSFTVALSLDGSGDLKVALFFRWSCGPFFYLKRTRYQYLFVSVAVCLSLLKIIKQKENKRKKTTKKKQSAGGGTRTQNLRNDSSKPCQLSYLDKYRALIHVLS